MDERDPELGATDTARRLYERLFANLQHRASRHTQKIGDVQESQRRNHVAGAGAAEADERKREDEDRESLKDICAPHDRFADEVADSSFPGKEAGPDAKQHSSGERD